MGFAFGMLVLRAAGLLAVAVLPIRISTVDGRKLEGNFHGVKEKALVVETNQGVEKLAFDDLVSIAPVAVSEGTPPKLRVTLAGGSLIAAQSVSLADDILAVELRRQPSLKIPVREVKSVRFRAASASTDPLWLGLLEQAPRADLLAIRRTTGQIDPAPGIVNGIANGKVEFMIDSDSIQAPIEKLEGVVFGAAKAPQQSTDIQLVDKYGSRWAAMSILPAGKEGPWRIKLSNKVTHEVPLDHIESIFWSGGFKLLASQTPAESTYEAYLKTAVSPKLLNDWFKPSAEDEDIVINGGGAVAYRIDSQYKTLAGAVRRDPLVNKAGEVTVKILLDDEVVWNQTIDDASPRGFELPINKARRVKFVAESGDDGDAGDIVRITRPRLLK